MTDTPTPPQTAPDGARSVPQPRDDAGQPQEGTEGPQGPVRGSRGADPRQPAYDAVYAHLSALGDHMPADRVHRNAMIWRAVHAALDAMEPQLDTVQRALREITATAELEERAARDTPLGREECRIVHSSRASGLREALSILGVQTGGGWDGPSIREAAANDRNWDVEKGGE